MYINLILGGIALIVVWLWLRKLLVKEDPPAPEPGKVDDAATILEAELEKRRSQGSDAQTPFERVRTASIGHLRPVATALDEMRSALPGQSRNRLSWNDAEDSLVIHMAGDAQKADQSLRVVWRMPDLNLDVAPEDLSRDKGVYVLRDMHSKKEESISDLKECVRRIAAFIADALA